MHHPGDLNHLRQGQLFCRVVCQTREPCCGGIQLINRGELFHNLHDSQGMLYASRGQVLGQVGEIRVDGHRLHYTRY